MLSFLEENIEIRVRDGGSITIEGKGLSPLTVSEVVSNINA